MTRDDTKQSRADGNQSVGGQDLETEAACREAVRLDPDNAQTHDNLGGVLLAHENYAEAEAAYREAARLDPGNAVYQDDLSEALYAQEKYTEAEAACREAVRLDPSNGEYHHDLGVVLFAQEKYAEAEAARPRRAKPRSKQGRISPRPRRDPVRPAEVRRSRNG